MSSVKSEPAISEGMARVSEVVVAMRDGHFSEGAEEFISADDNGLVCFKTQNGPRKTFGVNGCQVDDVLEFCLSFLRSVNKRFPCRENSLAITHLESTLHRLADRTKEREARDVEGRNAA